MRSIQNLASDISSFNILTYEDEILNKQLTLRLELIEGKNSSDFDINYLTDKIFDELRNINQDFRESSRMIPKENQPKIEIYNNGTGPFQDKDIRIKQKYITTSSKPA